MENKIDIAKILKDCPKGMELYCTMYEDLYFDYVDDKLNIIYCYLQYETYKSSITFKQYGTPNSNTKSKCVIFPKGKTTWEGFVPPCKFDDGHILATDLGSVFYLNTRLNTDECYGCFVGIGSDGSFHISEPFAYKECCRFATEGEKAKLFQAIKDNGYRWNAEIKTLEKLIELKFKVGDIIHDVDYKAQIIEINEKDKFYVFCSVIDNGIGAIPFEKQDNWKLVSKKFDITTLKPFDKVLVRVCDKSKWIGEFYMWYDDAGKDLPHNCCGGRWSQCVPFKGNEYLLGTTEDCNEYYKTW